MQTATLENTVVDILRKRCGIDTDILQEATYEAQQKGVRLEKWLVDHELVSGVDLALALGEYLKMPPIELSHFNPDNQLLDLLPQETMTRQLVVPVARSQSVLTLALGDPFNVMAIDEVHALTGLDVIPVVAPEQQIKDLLQRFTQSSAAGLEDILKDVSEGDIEVGMETQEDVSLDEMLESAEDAPVIRIVNSIMVEAIRKGASDIHIEPMERSIRLRYRIDGVLIESPSPPKALQSAIISRLKIMSNLDIAERRIPQDGRFRIRALNKEVDIRLSILPTVHGEKIVMRTLDKSSLAPSIAALGLDKTSNEQLMYAIAQPHGILLVTG
ncbi:MAG: secretion system protein E, partial [Spartobacteria bacterium]|nr:secretion system protein E [Spartobacteria bacterium]